MISLNDIFKTVTMCKALHYFYEKTAAIYNWRYNCNCNTLSDIGISVVVGSSIISCVYT